MKISKIRSLHFLMLPKRVSVQSFIKIEQVDPEKKGHEIPTEKA